MATFEEQYEHMIKNQLGQMLQSYLDAQTLIEQQKTSNQEESEKTYKQTSTTTAEHFTNGQDATHASSEDFGAPSSQPTAE